MRHRQRDAGRQCDGGFGLLEALVALVILAATLLTVQQALTAGVAARRRIDLEGRALATAKARLAAAGIESPLREETVAGTEQGMRWRLVVSRYAPPGRQDVTPKHSAWLVRVEVAWQDGLFSSERTISLTTVKLGGASP